MSILKKLREIRLKRSKKQEQKEEDAVVKSPPQDTPKEVTHQDQTEISTGTEAVETEKIYNIPRFTRCNSVFIQMASGVSSEDLTNQEEVETGSMEPENETATETTDDSIETIEENKVKKFNVRDSQVLSVLSQQAKQIVEAKEQKRPISLHMTPPYSVMKNEKNNSLQFESSKRKSLTIVDPKDPSHPHQVISRKEFLEELRMKNRLSFDSKDSLNK